MPVKMQPTSVIVSRLGLNPGGPAQSFFTETCYEHMDKYVPQDIGNLRTRVDIQPTYIIYEVPYARYQYYGIRNDGTHPVNPENYTTPGTGPYWDKRMVSAEMPEIEKKVEEYIYYHGGRA